MNKHKKLYKGRKPLITDLSSISGSKALMSELERIMPYFERNRKEVRYLQEYYKGDHPTILKRDKKIRGDINNKTVVNYAFSATRDIVGYYLGKPIQYVHRGTSSEDNSVISEFNRILDAEDKNLYNSQIAQDQSICGTAYLGIFRDMQRKNGTSLKLRRLDPAFTFVVTSSDPEVDELYCVTYHKKQPDSMGLIEGKCVYTVWTKDARYTIESNDPGSFTAAASKVLSSQPFSYGGYLPIQEYPNNVFRIGDWEPALPLMDAIDVSASDRGNDIEQTVQAILVALGVDLSKDGVLDMLMEKGLLNVPNVADGAMNPVIDYIGTPLDPNIGGTFSDYLESCMNVVIGVPDRKTRGGVGGDTGAAVELRDGWVDIDLVASFKEGFFVQADRNALGAILYLLSTNHDFEGLEVRDVEIKFSRNKTANIQVKSLALSTLISAGIHPQDAIEWCDVTNDVLSVVDRMKEWKDEVQQNSIDFANKQFEEIKTPPEETAGQSLPASGSKSSQKKGTDPVTPKKDDPKESDAK